jgi:hypothetical protein
MGFDWWAFMILKVTEQYIFSDPKFSKSSMNLTIFGYADLMVR